MVSIAITTAVLFAVLLTIIYLDWLADKISQTYKKRKTNGTSRATRIFGSTFKATQHQSKDNKLE